MRGKRPMVVRWWKPVTEDSDEVAEYRKIDHERAVAEIRSLVDRINRGDVVLVQNETWNYFHLVEELIA